MLGIAKLRIFKKLILLQFILQVMQGSTGPHKRTARKFSLEQLRKLLLRLGKILPAEFRE